MNASILDSSKSWLPSYLSHNIEKATNASSLAEKVHLLGRVYELLVRTLTITLVSQYLIQDKDKLQDTYLNDLLLNKFPQLTSDAWLKLFFAAIKAYGNSRAYLFIQEIYDLYWDTSQKPHVYKLENENVLKRLGQIFAEIEVPKFAPKDETEWSTVLAECEELMAGMFEKFDFLQNYELVRVLRTGNEEVELELHKGLQTSLTKRSASSLRLNRGWFYWYREEDPAFLPLHPFLVFWEEVVAEKDVAVYDKYIYDRLQYLLTLLGKTVIDNKGVKDFIYLVVETLQEAKRKREQVEKLEWKQVSEMCRNISQHRMATVRHKYRPELYLQRSHAYRSFEKYLESDKKVFVLVGKSGVGKSNFILALADILMEREGMCALMYDGAQLKVEPSMHRVIAEDFNERLTIGGKKVEDVWRELGKVEGIGEKRVILFVDAINENPQAKELLRQLDDLAQTPWLWLKIVFTCRPETWQVIRRGVKLAEGLYYQELEGEAIGVELKPFAYSEKLEEFSRQELDSVYEKYKGKYQLKSEFEDLSVGIKEILRDPLNLWLVSNIYQRREIPKGLSVSDLVEDYMSSLVENGILLGEDIRFLEKRLVPLMMGTKGKILNVLTTGDIDETGEELYESIFSEQVLSDGTRRNQSFTNLVDTEILVRNTVGHSQQITFKYERFYEYFSGKKLLEESQRETDKARYLLNWAEKTGEYPFLWGAVKNALVQMVRKEKEGVEMLKRLSFTEKQNIKELIVVVLGEVGQNDIVLAEDMLMILLKEARLRSAKLPLMWMRKNEYEQRVVNMKKVVVEVASGLGLMNVIVEVAGDRNKKVQAHAVKYAYYVWLRKNEKGYEILEKVGEQTMNRWGLPNMRKLDFFINLILLIFFQHVNESITRTRLRESLREVIRKIFYVDFKPLGINLYGLDYWLRELIINLSISLVIKLTSSHPRYFPANLYELSYLYDTVSKDRELVARLLGYLDATAPDFHVFVGDVTRVADTNDAFVMYLMIHALLIQSRNFENRLLPVLENIYMDSISRGKSAAAGDIIFSIYWAFLFTPELREKNLDAKDLLLKLQENWIENTKGVHRFRSGEEYCGNLTLDTLALLENIEDYRASPIANYIRVAVEKRDTQFAIDLLWELQGIAIHNMIPIALAAVEPMLGFNDSLVQSALIAFLARIRQYNPFLVDDFMAEHNYPESVIQKVHSAETSEQENEIFRKAIPFIYHELPNSTYLRQQAIDLYTNILTSKNLRAGIIVVIKKLITVIYGKNIFMRG